jgi:pimeloyl-ACP methyl ester carboxylesterase
LAFASVLLVLASFGPPTRLAVQYGALESFRDIPERAIRAIAAPTLVMVGDHDVMSVEHDAQLTRPGWRRR